jgi:hypothetical protein
VAAGPRKQDARGTHPISKSARVLHTHSMADDIKLEDLRRWAQETGLVAATTSDIVVKSALLDIAGQYDVLANWLQNDSKAARTSATNRSL